MLMVVQVPHTNPPEVSPSPIGRSYRCNVCRILACCIVLQFDELTEKSSSGGRKKWDLEKVQLKFSITFEILDMGFVEFGTMEEC